METIDKTKPEVVDDKPQQVKADLRKFNRTEEMVNKALATLSVITAIASKEECDAALITLKESKTVENKIEDKRKELVKPFNDASKKINAHAKTLTEKLPGEIDRVKKLVVGFQQEEERKFVQQRSNARTQQLLLMGFVEEEKFFVFQSEVTVFKYQVEQCDDSQWSNVIGDAVVEINRLQESKLQSEEMDTMFGTDGPSAVEEKQIHAQPIAAEEVSMPVVATKVKGITKRWTFEVEDSSQVPREYLIVDEKKIREAVNAGTRIIPGVRIYEDTSLTIR